MSEKKIVAEHIMKKTLKEYLHIPSHDERTETKEFRNAKHELESVEHLNCFKCGSNKKLQSHHIFERSWGNGFDYRKVAYFLFTHFDFHGHCHRDFDSHEELLKYFMDNFNGHIVKGEDEFGNPYEYVMCDDECLDTIYNQLILCFGDHIQSTQGIHEVDGATWIAGLVVHPEFDNTFTKDESESFEQ